MNIRLDDLSHPAVIALLEEHLRDVYQDTSNDNPHEFDLQRFKEPNVRFYSLWDNEQLLGCAAIKALDDFSAEIKSMRVVAEHRGKGYGRALLDHLLEQARASGVQYFYLETGTPEYFNAARQLYSQAGFIECDPFADYHDDPYSLFMYKAL